jgi:hypothetical protein
VLFFDSFKESFDGQFVPPHVVLFFGGRISPLDRNVGPGVSHLSKDRVNVSGIRLLFEDQDFGFRFDGSFSWHDVPPPRVKYVINDHIVT